MLNKNQSKKRNSWKYAFVLPLLGAFVFFFQVKVVAQEKNSKNTTKNKSEIIITIDKNFSDKELKKETELFKKEYDCDLIFSEIERNSDDEIIGITVNYNKNIYGNGTYKQHSKNTIEPFYIKRDVSNKINISNASLDKKFNENKTKVNLKDKKSNTKMKEIFINGSKESQEELDKLNPNEIESMNVINNKNQQEIRIVTKKFSKVLNDNDIYINDEKTDKNKLLILDENTIDKMNINTKEKTIRITTKTINQSSDDIEILNTPTPPIAPTFKTKPPIPPKPPKAPKGDPIHGDKKAWTDFDYKMEEFDKKMQIFDKKMQSFDSEMEVFDSEMESFDKKMQIYNQQMEEYQLKLNAKKKY